MDLVTQTLSYNIQMIMTTMGGGDKTAKKKVLLLRDQCPHRDFLVKKLR